jgi:peptidylprolyl isomerase
MVDDQQVSNKVETAGPKKFSLKPVHGIAIAVVLAVLVVLAYVAISSSAFSAPVVAVGDNISVYYTGTLTNGTVFDSNVGKQPLQFVVGSGQMIKGFDQGVVGMRLNETKNITIPPAQAYGEVNQSLIVQVPRSQFGNMTLSNGLEVSTSAGQQAVIKGFNATSVTVDFNPLLAGQTLTFQIRVVEINGKT